MKMMQPRRQFIKTVAAGIGTAGVIAGAQEIPRLVELRPPDRPRGRPTLWIGAVSPDGGVVKTKLPPGTPCRLLVRAPGATPLAFQPLLPRDSQSRIVTFQLGGLQPSTTYTCTLEVSGRPATHPPATLRTFPPSGRASSFSFAFASCARTGSQHKVFETILRKQPALFLHLGDLHYANISRADSRMFRAAWDTVLSSTTQGALYRNIPLAYIWDDHDFGPNNSDSRSPSRAVARAVYREYMPHYPLVAGDGDAPIHQAFSIGRVRFILTDLRSERSPEQAPDGPGKTMLGAAQKEWLKRELLTSCASHALVFLTSTVPWIGTGRGSDAWQYYAHERRELCDFLAAARIRNLCILCGDAHMLAADSGVHSDYSAAQTLRIPVLHGSALDQGGSYKGGPYSEGYYLPASGEGCFGWVEVHDSGNSVEVNYSGRTHDDAVQVAYQFRV